MGSDMQISRGLKIKGYVVKPQDIRELAKKVYEEYESDDEKPNYKEIKFILKEADGIRYESEDLKILSENGLLDTRRIIGVEIAYFNYKSMRGISVKLDHAPRDYGSENYIYVSGPDELWVNGVIKSFESIIANWEKQVSLLYNYSWPLQAVFALVIGFPLFYLLHQIYSSPSSESQLGTKIAVFVDYFIYFMLAFILGMWPASIIVDQLKKLYPIVELRTGPQHTHMEANRRKKLYFILTMGVLPLIISLLVKFL